MFKVEEYQDGTLTDTETFSDIKALVTNLLEAASKEYIIEVLEWAFDPSEQSITINHSPELFDCWHKVGIVLERPLKDWDGEGMSVFPPHIRRIKN